MRVRDTRAAAADIDPSATKGVHIRPYLTDVPVPLPVSFDCFHPRLHALALGLALALSCFDIDEMGNFLSLMTCIFVNLQRNCFVELHCSWMHSKMPLTDSPSVAAASEHMNFLIVTD